MSQGVDTLALVLKMLQEHLRMDTARPGSIAGQTKYDSTVMIAAISMIGTVMMGIVGLIANIFAKRIDAIHKAIEKGQSS